MIVSLARLALLFRALMCDIALPVEPESNEEWRKRTIREIAVLHARFITRMSEQSWPPVEKSLWTGVVTKGRHQRSSPMVGTSHYIARVHGTKDVVHVPRCVLCRIRDNLHQVARIEAVRSNGTRAHGRSRPAVSARILHQVLPVGPSLSNGPLHQQGAVFFVLKKR